MGLSVFFVELLILNFSFLVTFDILPELLFFRHFGDVFNSSLNVGILKVDIIVTPYR